jgi:plasmid stability protein
MSKMIRVRNVPEELHRRLASRAALAGMSLSDYLLAELRRSADRPSPEEMRRRLAECRPVTLAESAVAAVRAERDAR